MPVGTHQRLSGAWRLCSCRLHLLMHSRPLCIHWNDEDGFVCSLAGNKWSIWDYCDNAVIGRMSLSWNYWSVNVLQQGTVARSEWSFMYDQWYRDSTRTTEAPLSLLHIPIICTWNIPILFGPSGAFWRIASSTLVVQTVDLKRGSTSYWMSLQPSRITHLRILEVLSPWEFFEQEKKTFDLKMECPRSSGTKQVIYEWSR